MEGPERAVIIGRSRARRRIYLLEGTPTTQAQKWQAKGYEVVWLGRPVALYIQTNVGKCSTPHNGLSARHCFGTPAERVEGRRYTIEADGLSGTGYVNQDFSPPWRNWLARFFGPLLGAVGARIGVRDIVGVTRYCTGTWSPGQGLITTEMVGVLSAGAQGQKYWFVAPLSSTAQTWIGRQVAALADVPERRTLKGLVEDYGLFMVWHQDGPWPLELLLVAGEEPAVPGNSGSPVYPGEALGTLRVSCQG